MSGTLVIWRLLTQAAPVVAVVPLARIKEGDLPLNTVLPAISITRVSGVPRLTLAMTEPNRMYTERVQVSVLTKGTEGTPAGLGKKGCDALLVLVRAALPNQRGTIAGVTVDSILPAEVGPDLQDETVVDYQGSQDFRIVWKEAT